MIASANGHEEVVKLLLERGAAVDLCCQVSGMSALHYACFNGQLKTVELLVKANVLILILNYISGLQI